MNTSRMNDAESAAFISNKPVSGGSQSLRQQVGLDALPDGTYRTQVEFNRYAAAKEGGAVETAGGSIIAAIVAAVKIPGSS